MSGPKAASKPAGGGSAIPAGDQKLISHVREVVTNISEEEIYAMLKECNRDPNEAVQRLMNEGKFHVVKRKRDKKKEIGSVKDTSTSQQAIFGNHGKNGKTTGSTGGRNAGKGTSSLRSSMNEGTGGRSKVQLAAAAKENHSFVKVPSKMVGEGLSYSQLVQPKGSFSNLLNNALPSASGPLNSDVVPAAASPGSDQAWPSSSGYGTSTTLQGAWLAGSGHGTFADMLRSGVRKSIPPSGTQISGEVVGSTVSANSSFDHLSLPSTHLMPSLTLDSHTRSPDSTAKHELGAGGIPRLHADISSFGLQNTDSAQYTQADISVASVDRDVGISSLQPSNVNLSLPSEEQVQSSSRFSVGHRISVEIADVHEGQFNVVPVYQAQDFESQQDRTDADWRSHLITHEEAPTEGMPGALISDGISAGPPSPSTNAGILSITTAKLQEMSLRDDHSVIIPDHIRVSEAECTMLSFGSFGAGFDSLASNSSFLGEERDHAFSVCETTSVSDLGVAMRSLSTSTMPSANSDHDQHISSISVQNLHPSADVSGLDDETNIKEEESSEQTTQHEYPPNYSVMNAVSSDPTGRYTVTSEEMEPRPREANGLLPPYDNSTYYSGVFRSVSENDSRYSAFSQLAATGKLGSTSRPSEPTVQSAAQEVVNVNVYSSSNSGGGHTIPNVNSSLATMALPQHSIHPYATQPSGLPLGPLANVLSYQYMPPGFPYVQSPYQHNYADTGNYHHVPAAMGAGGMKYPVPQYKSGGPVVGGMHNAISPNSLGYGGYPNTQLAANSPVTAAAANASTFDDAASQHYKDSSMYLPTQQMDGPSVWLQSQLARDAQGSSYYNVLLSQSQQQPTRYSQSQQSILTAPAYHPGAAYGNLYQAQQSGSSPSAHQLLQQQQALGALGAQIGSYQQNQRAQVTWAPGGF